MAFKENATYSPFTKVMLFTDEDIFSVINLSPIYCIFISLITENRALYYKRHSFQFSLQAFLLYSCIFNSDYKIKFLLFRILPSVW